VGGCRGKIWGERAAIVGLGLGEMDTKRFSIGDYIGERSSSGRSRGMRQERQPASWDRGGAWRAPGLLFISPPILTAAAQLCRGDERDDETGGRLQILFSPFTSWSALWAGSSKLGPEPS
jgi:hypothetical protein